MTPGTVLAGVAWAQAGRAGEQRDLAVSRRLISEARAQLRADAELGLLLAEQAYPHRADADSEALLRQAVTESRLVTTDADHRAAVTGVAFSPDGQRIASVDVGGGVRVQDRTRDARTLVTRRNRGPAFDVSFSPDGRRLSVAGVAAGGHGSIRTALDGELPAGSSAW